MPPLKLVLDTNIILDWLLFNYVSMTPLQQGTQDGRIAVITHPPAVEELRRVLTYPQFKLDADRQKEVLAAYQACATTAVLPDGFALDNLLLPERFPRCRDGDDDHFLALAYHAGADALASKDKAVLKLRKRAAKFGVRILSAPQLLEMVAAISTERPTNL